MSSFYSLERLNLLQLWHHMLLLPRQVLASRDSSWIIYSETSSHMTDSRDFYSRLSQLSNIRSLQMVGLVVCQDNA